MPADRAFPLPPFHAWSAAGRLLGLSLVVDLCLSDQWTTATTVTPTSPAAVTMTSRSCGGLASPIITSTHGPHLGEILFAIARRPALDQGVCGFSRCSYNKAELKGQNLPCGGRRTAQELTGVKTGRVRHGPHNL